MPRYFSTSYAERSTFKLRSHYDMFFAIDPSHRGYFRDKERHQHGDSRAVTPKSQD